MPTAGPERIGDIVPVVIRGVEPNSLAGVVAPSGATLPSDNKHGEAA